MSLVSNGGRLHVVSCGVVSIQNGYESLFIDVDRGTTLNASGPLFFDGAVGILESDIVLVDPHTGRRTVILHGEKPSFFSSWWGRGDIVG